MENYDLVIIGGGVAGMSCGLSAEKQGVKKILLLERKESLGGILTQCIHDGFGLLTFEKSLTGPEFSSVFEEKLANSKNIEIERGAFVEKINYEKAPYKIEYIGSGKLKTATAKSIVLATGSRERAFGSFRIPGTRPAGIFSAGSCQYMMNVKNILPGKSAVIMGLGDIGMIMARRMTLEGINVKLILGLELTGLKRNFQNCVKDFEIPYKIGYGVACVHGKKRLKGVTIAPFDQNTNSLDLSKKEYIPCDTLLVAAGLIPERDLCPKEEKDGVFLCGNVSKISPLADYVSAEGEYIGLKSAQFILGENGEREKEIEALKEKIQNNSLSNFLEEQDDSITCLGCPKSCGLKIKKLDDGSISVSGNSCPVGEKFALSELKNPKRTLTTTVKSENGQLIPVKSEKPIPKELLIPACKKLKRLTVSQETIKNGVILKNILGTDVNIVI